MEKQIYSWLIIIYLYITKSSVADQCTIRDDGHCFYTVNCDDPARISINRPCDTDPYITLIINKSPVHNVTANVFNTSFDKYVRILSTEDNNWNNVQDFAFSNFKNVMYIDLSESHIKSIGRAFIGLGQLDSLNLSRNDLEIIDPGVFKFTEDKSRLYLLDLSYNLLTYLQEDFFENLYNLRKLYLQGNKLTFLGDQYSNHLKNLDYLNLCCSNLSTLDISLKSLTNLTEIDLSNNNLEKVDLFDLKSLEAIDLSHNNIEEVMFDEFKEFANLREINFGYNKLKNIFASDDNLVTKVSKPLVKVQFDHNNISHIDRGFFTFFSHISLLDLSHNILIEFEPDTFKHVKVLQVLNVPNCRVTISKEILSTLENTYIFDSTKNDDDCRKGSYNVNNEIKYTEKFMRNKILNLEEPIPKYQVTNGFLNSVLLDKIRFYLSGFVNKIYT
nr:leucine-rich repeat-containing protein 70-like isoform X2 [Helicoverpa armigera]